MRWRASATPTDARVSWRRASAAPSAAATERRVARDVAQERRARRGFHNTDARVERVGVGTLSSGASVSSSAAAAAGSAAAAEEGAAVAASAARSLGTSPGGCAATLRRRRTTTCRSAQTANPSETREPQDGARRHRRAATVAAAARRRRVRSRGPADGPLATRRGGAGGTGGAGRASVRSERSRRRSHRRALRTREYARLHPVGSLVARSRSPSSRLRFLGGLLHPSRARRLRRRRARRSFRTSAASHGLRLGPAQRRALPSSRRRASSSLVLVSTRAARAVASCCGAPCNAARVGNLHRRRPSGSDDSRVSRESPRRLFDPGRIPRASPVR